MRGEAAKRLTITMISTLERVKNYSKVVVRRA